MVRVIVYCEGLTEETFVNEMLVGYFAHKGIFLTASQCGSGGVSKYSRIKRDITRWCRQDSSRYVTTMIDYYGLPSETPGLQNNKTNIYEKVLETEDRIFKDIGENNFIPNLILHEFEALLFSDVSVFKRLDFDGSLVDKLMEIRNSFDSPECIDGGFETSPSHRLRKLIFGYSKPINGKNLAKEIGIDRMRAECKHFDEWIQKIESLV